VGGASSGATGTGGVTTTGNSATGGVHGPGGTTASNGSPVASGGSTPESGGSGGRTATGGVTGNGGRSGSGGVASSGGMTEVGGATNTGGKIGSGGSVATGGLAASGGTKGPGGATGSGGGSICTPSCANKECGTDGCDGTCGGCVPSQMCGANGTCQAKSGSGILVDVNSQLTPISPDIYGVAFASDSTDDSHNVATLDRWGGDAEESYNWQKVQHAARSKP
jgi:hypothetical protein